jgi:CrcB protein
MTWILIGVFGGLGAFSRYRVSGIVQRRWKTLFPVGTLVVNLSGAFAAGILVGLATGRGVPDVVLSAAGVGFLGGYTTFSTWMVETILTERSGGRIGVKRGIQNIVVTLVFGVALAAVGYALGRWT